LSDRVTAFASAVGAGDQAVAHFPGNDDLSRSQGLCPSIEPVPPVGGIICSFVYWQLGAVNGPERARLAS